MKKGYSRTTFSRTHISAEKFIYGSFYLLTEADTRQGEIIRVHDYKFCFKDGSVVSKVAKGGRVYLIKMNPNTFYLTVWTKNVEKKCVTVEELSTVASNNKRKQIQQSYHSTWMKNIFKASAKWSVFSKAVDYGSIVLLTRNPLHMFFRVLDLSYRRNSPQD